MPSTTNAVAATTAYVAKLVASGSTAPQTPAQYAAAAGYKGSAASSVRKHIARQHGQGAQATGHGRYPAITPRAMLALLQGGNLPVQATKAQQAKAASAAKRTLWVAKAAPKAKRAAKAAPAPASTPAVPAA